VIAGCHRITYRTGQHLHVTVGYIPTEVTGVSLTGRQPSRLLVWRDTGGRVCSVGAHLVVRVEALDAADNDKPAAWPPPAGPHRPHPT
jgi:hypothetical protein